MHPAQRVTTKRSTGTCNRFPNCANSTVHRSYNFEFWVAFSSLELWRCEGLIEWEVVLVHKVQKMAALMLLKSCSLP